MKNLFTSFRRLLMTSVLCLGAALIVQSKEVEVTASAHLSDLLSKEDLQSLTELIVTTNGTDLTAADFDIINEMSSVKIVDLSNATAENQLMPANLQKNKIIEIFKLPGNTKNIAGGAFSECAMKQIYIPATVNGTGNVRSRFDKCKNLTEVIVDVANTTLKSVNGVVYSKDGTELALYPSGKTDTDFEIPEGVIKFSGAYSMGNNDNLKSITFPASFTTFADKNYRDVDGNINLENFYVSEDNPLYGSMSGMLYNKQTHELMIFPAGSKVESLSIDGSEIKNVGDGFFKKADRLKRIIFTEGIETLGAGLFKTESGVSNLEYVELPSTLIQIGGECFANCTNLVQIVCKAITPPGFVKVDRTPQGGEICMGSANFRGLPADTKVGVSEKSLEAYKNSWWDRNYSESGIKNDVQGFYDDQFVVYRTVNVVGGIASQDVSVPGYRVEVVASTPSEEGIAFSKWESDPQVVFTNINNKNTSFTMPDTDVTITAVFAATKAYNIVDAITPSGVAAIGSIVEIEAPSSKEGKAFKKWEIVEGDGLIIDDPNARVTTFVMIDGPVTIRAVYEMLYMINIVGGQAFVDDNPVLDVAPGTRVTVVADENSNQEFVNWSTETVGVAFEDVNNKITTFLMPESDVDIIANFKSVTGLEKVSSSQIKIYPNPVSECFQILGEVDSFSIYDLSGKLVKFVQSYQGEFISVTNLSAGTYIIRMKDKSELFIKK